MLEPDVVKVMRARRRIGRLRHVPFIGGNAFNAPGLLDEAGAAAEGAISGAAWIATEDTPGTDALAGLRDVPIVLGTFSFDADREPQYAPVIQQVRRGRDVKIGC